MEARELRNIVEDGKEFCKSWLRPAGERRAGHAVPADVRYEDGDDVRECVGDRIRRKTVEELRMAFFDAGRGVDAAAFWAAWRALGATRAPLGARLELYDFEAGAQAGKGGCCARTPGERFAREGAREISDR